MTEINPGSLYRNADLEIFYLAAQDLEGNTAAIATGTSDLRGSNKELLIFRVRTNEMKSEWNNLEDESVSEVGTVYRGSQGPIYKSLSEYLGLSPEIQTIRADIEGKEVTLILPEQFETEYRSFNN